MVDVPDFLDKPKHYLRIEQNTWNKMLTKYEEKAKKARSQGYYEGFLTGMIATCAALLLIYWLIHGMYM